MAAIRGMSGGGQPPGGPAPQPPPAVAAALEATRAKFNLMQQQQGARGGQPNGAAADVRPAGVAGPVGSIPVGRAAGVPPPPLGSARNNPMFGEVRTQMLHALMAVRCMQPVICTL